MEYSTETEALLAQGEMRLLQKDLIGVELFQKAAEIEPNNCELFIQQGLALFEYGCEEKQEKILLLASKKLKTASQINGQEFRVWQVWGDILSHLGKMTGEYHYFLDAKEKYSKAISLSSGQSQEFLSDLYWENGLVWKQIANHSGEAFDLQFAVESFNKATQHSDQLPAEFWNAYGQSCLDLAKQINDIRLYVKAINCFKHSISSSSSEGWLLLAGALQMLYGHTHDEDHFSQANECFSAAAQFHPQEDAELWYNWAKFLCEAGRRHQDLKKLRSCIEKCHRAHACNPEHFLAMGVWAEALAIIGELTERLDLIVEAQNKISEASQMAPEHPDIWFSFGMCLLSFARYYNEPDYYYQAIEKFQEGLSIDRTCYRHWHAIGNIYATLGAFDGDVESYERACRFYLKAIDLYPSSFYIFDYALTLSKLGEITEEQKWFEEAVIQFERALNMQKNAIYIHPDWLFHYATTLDALGDYYEDKSYYTRAIEILSHVLMIDPDFPFIHHRLALANSHLGDLLEESDHYYRSVHHYRLAAKHEEENDQILLDWGVTLLSLSQYIQDSPETDQFFREAEHKLTQAAKLGNLQAFYNLGCLFSLQGQHEKSIRFLEKADAFQALPPIEDILEDDWLDGVRGTSEFQAFLMQLEKRPNLHEER